LINELEELQRESPKVTKINEGIILAKVQRLEQVLAVSNAPNLEKRKAVRKKCKIKKKMVIHLPLIIYLKIL